MEYVLAVVGMLVIVGALAPAAVVKRELEFWRWRRRARRTGLRLSARLTRP
jgi:hypothetical protein